MEMDAPYLKKLEKCKCLYYAVLPETYNKIIAATKPEPLHENNKIKSKKRISK